MTRVPLLLSVFLAIPGLVMAQGAPATPPPAQTQPLPQAQLSPQAQLKTSSTRWGAGVHVQKESIDFFSCADRCARSPASLSVPLPLEAQGKKSRVKVLQLKDGVSAFLIEVGDAEARHYSVLVLGADRGPIVEGAGSEQPLPAPALVLKGWTEPGQQQLSVQESTSGVRVLLISGVTQAVCGRTLPEQTKMLDPKSGQFRVSRLPVLAAEERKNARPLPLSLLSWSENDVALRLQAKAGKEAVAVDGDRQLPWDQGHEYVEFTLPDAAKPHELLLKLAETKDAVASQMWLATTESVFSLELPAVSGGLLAVNLPEQSGFEAGACVALVQSQVPAPLAEVFSRIVVEQPVPPFELIARLERPDAGWTESALGFAGTETIELLAERFSRLNPLGRERALAVAQSLPHGAGIPVFAVAFELGDEEQKKIALALLKAHPEVAVRNLAKRLHFSSTSTLDDIAITMVELDVETAVPLLLEEVKRERPSVRRAVLREALARVAKSEQGRSVLRPHIEQKVKWPRHVQLELVRALRPSLAEWHAPSVKLVESLATGATFREAYLLAPVVSDLLDQSSVLGTIYGDWLSGKLKVNLKPTQKAALQVYLFELLNEREGNLKHEYRKESVNLLKSENVRVRASALTWLSRFPAEDLVGLTEDLLDDDPWPQVRSAAALVLGSVAASVELVREDVIDNLGSELKSEKDAGVRRALVRALSEVDSPDSKNDLRRAYEKDDDYKVRAEAARALGRLCDVDSTESLTDLAHDLTREPVGEGPVILSLAALSALIELNPPDLDERVAPLLSDDVPGVLRARVQARVNERKPTVGCQVSVR